MDEKTDNISTAGGIVKSISTKYAPWKKFCLQEDDKKWYATKKELGFNKGDKISFRFTMSENGEYKNYYLSGDAKVLEKTQVTNNFSQPKDDYRVNVDAGNCVERAKDVVVAMINAGDKEDVDKKMEFLTGVMAKEFNHAKELLESKVPEAAIKENTETQQKVDTQQETKEEYPVVKPDQY